MFYEEMFRHWHIRNRSGGAMSDSQTSSASVATIDLDGESEDEGGDLSQILDVKVKDEPFVDEDPYLFLERARLQEQAESIMEALQKAMELDDLDEEEPIDPEEIPNLPSPEKMNGSNSADDTVTTPEPPTTTETTCDEGLVPLRKTGVIKVSLVSPTDLDDKIKQLRYCGCALVNITVS